MEGSGELAINVGTNTLGMSASLAYFGTYRHARFPANLVQAQQDLVLSTYNGPRLLIRIRHTSELVVQVQIMLLLTKFKFLSRHTKFCLSVLNFI